jgi:hypothetical protein
VRRLRWDTPHRKVPKHPYRDSAVVYGILAVALVGLTVATGGPLFPGDDQDKGGALGALSELGALAVAGIVFVLATGFSWWRWRRQLKRQEEGP